MLVLCSFYIIFETIKMHCHCTKIDFFEWSHFFVCFEHPNKCHIYDDVLLCAWTLCIFRSYSRHSIALEFIIIQGIFFSFFFILNITHSSALLLFNYIEMCLRDHIVYWSERREIFGIFPGKIVQHTETKCDYVCESVAVWAYALGRNWLLLSFCSFFLRLLYFNQKISQCFFIRLFDKLWHFISFVRQMWCEVPFDCRNEEYACIGWKGMVMLWFNSFWGLKSLFN